jgi:hypothetical protein
LAALPASAAPRAAAPATIRVIVAPVTASGHAASGFTVKPDRQYQVFCAPTSPSPVSISPNVAECSPSAAYAVACWKSATPKQALCLLDPRKHILKAGRLMNGFAPTKAVPNKELSPFVLILTDGTVCSIRDGGAWGYLKSHPKYFGTYSCSKHGVVWSPPNAVHYGVDESSSSWTVQTGSAAGKGGLTTRHVARAYFVATATG